MNDEEDKKPTAEHESVVERYQRRGGTARKDEARPRLWDRMRGRRPSRPDEAAVDGEGAEAASSTGAGGGAAPGSAAGDQAARAGDAAPRTPERLAVELVLPDDRRLLLLVRAADRQATGLLLLRVEPAPANAPDVLAGLSVLAHEPGQGQAAQGQRGPAAPRSIDIDMSEINEDAETHGDGDPTPPDGSLLAAPGVPPLALGSIPLPPIEQLQGQARGSDTNEEIPLAEPAEPDEPEPQDSLDSSDFLPPITGDILLEDPTPARPAARQTGSAAISRGGSAGADYFDDEERRWRLRRTKPAEAAVTPGQQAQRQPPARSPAPPAPAEAQQTQPTRPPAQPSPADRGAVMTPPAALPEAPAALHRPEGPLEQQLEGALPVNTQERAQAVSPTGPGIKKSLLPIVGIDFGTSYSSIALMRAGVELIPGDDGALQMPTVISLPQPGEVLIGKEARRRMAGAAQFTITSPKRLLGRLYKDPQVGQVIGGLAFRTFAGTDKFVRFEAHGEIYSVTDICAMILGKLREQACRYLGSEVSKAVFSVPVGFGSLQRSALEVAARQAGLEVVGLIAEPSAAVLSHGFRGHKGVVAVYDFGGGTFDFSVIQVTETAFRVLCAGGDPWLGGDDFDRTMADYFADQFWKSTGVDLHNRAVEWQALLFECERAKRQLSVQSSAELRIDDLLLTARGNKGLRYKINRKLFNSITHDLVKQSIAETERVMQQAGMSPRQVDAVCLTGGTSQIPAIRAAVTRYFGRQAMEGDPDLAVVRGSALRAAELKGEASSCASMAGRTLREVAGRTIGAGPSGGPVVTLFERDTPVPAEAFKSFATQQDDQTEMIIVLYEASKSRVDESRSIGQLRYTGLHPAPAGAARVDFTFNLEEDGILHVTAIVEGKEHSRSIKLD